MHLIISAKVKKVQAAQDCVLSLYSVKYKEGKQRYFEEGSGLNIYLINIESRKKQIRILKLIAVMRLEWPWF
jgi:hypothetical protein